MKPSPIRRFARNVARVMLVLTVAVLSVGCGHMLGHMMGLGAGHAVRPADTEFGLGPRVSQRHVYTASLQTGTLKVRRLQTVQVLITDAGNNAVDNAVITVDGGMPEHGHGLPTQPRAEALGNGLYAIEGLRFNMGGWWELKLAIASSAGTDNVTFNLDL